MTTKIITSYITLLCLAFAMTGAITANASEVTGTLSSDTSNTNSGTQTPDGNITGTVISESSGGGGGGTISGGNNLANAPTGSVLGATDSTTVQTPGFPNAGTAPKTSSSDPSLWSTIVNLFKTLLHF